jgi:3-dehydroquinate dehydratase II
MTNPLRIWVLHGPNLNRLGLREPAIYGHTTLDQINDQLVTLGRRLNASVDPFQSNHEGALIDRIHAAASQRVDGIVINPGGFTHTSVALRDALASVSIPFIEVHISNVFRREPFRHHSYFSDLAIGVVCGLGPFGYEAALQSLVHTLTPSANDKD